jgi:molybdenum cofactor cytidylyltransferase
LGLERPRQLVAIVGGGGKTSLLFALARELDGGVVATTTTRIFAAQMELADATCSLDEPGWRDRLDGLESHLLLVGHVEGERAMGVSRELPAQWLSHPRVDWVLVESDGSRMRPVKAPAEHEPVIPGEAALVVPVAGIDALSAPIDRVAHRPERVASISGLGTDCTLTPEALAAVLTSPRGGLKGVPPHARVALLLNKVESESEREAAHQVARFALREPRVERVVIGALRPTGPDRGFWEWCSRSSVG